MDEKEEETEQIIMKIIWKKKKNNYSRFSSIFFSSFFGIISVPGPIQIGENKNLFSFYLLFPSIQRNNWIHMNIDKCVHRIVVCERSVSIKIDHMQIEAVVYWSHVHQVERVPSYPAIPSHRIWWLYSVRCVHMENWTRRTHQSY